MAMTLTGDVHVAPTDELYDHLGHVLTSAAAQAVDARGVFHLALSGGATPEPFYVRLVTDPRFRAMPWRHTHVWMVDERRVPDSDPRSNIRMIRESLLDHVPIPHRQVHPMPVMSAGSPEAYEDVLRRMIPGEPLEDIIGPAQPVPRLDWVLLGMGEDGHTASLFPHSPVLAVRDRLVAISDGPAVAPPPRVTLTYPILAAAREAAVLVTGGKKHPTLRRVQEHVMGGFNEVADLPVAGVDPVAGTLTWYLDVEAGSGQSERRV